MEKMALYTIWVSLIMASLCGASYASAPVVSLSNGLQIVGKSSQVGNSFRGIRYAKAPLGSLRWAPPQAWVPSQKELNEPYNATELRSVCPQTQSMCTSHGCSEDCLFLNVFTGSNTAEKARESGDLLPVAIFVHGGAYKSGSSNLYPAGELVNFWEGRAIVVTINYRLNVLGFLGSKQLRSLDTLDGSTGNQGIQDQRLAFKWVKENIAAFGGDYSRVMIFGESAGAGSMSMHLTMKKSFEYYSKVILESGSFAPWTMQPMGHAQEIYEAFVAGTSCNLDDLSCLQALSLAEVEEAMKGIGQHGIDENDRYEPFSPTADGVEATTHAWIAVANGDVNHVPVLHGTNRDEGSMFCPQLPKNATMAQLHAYWGSLGISPADKTTLDALYVTGKTYPVIEGTSNEWWAGQRSLGDAIMSCPAKHASLSISGQQHVYEYFFEHVSSYADDNADLVTHASELPYVFHMNPLFFKSPPDRGMSNVMATYWGNFLMSAKSDPNEHHVGVPNLPTWPLFSAADDVHVMDLVERSNVADIASFKDGECAYWIPYTDAILQADFQ